MVMWTLRVVIDVVLSCSCYMHRFIFDFLSPLGLTPMTCSTLLSQCGKAIAWLTAESRSFRTGINIEKFMDAITVQLQVHRTTKDGKPYST